MIRFGVPVLLIYVARQLHDAGSPGLGMAVFMAACLWLPFALAWPDDTRA